MSEQMADKRSQTPTTALDDGAKKYERSQIKFPYSDISDAERVACAIKNVHGSRCTLDQLAIALGGASVKSGAFRTKVATARAFGAIESSHGEVVLTDLGHRLVDEHTRPAALVDAFLEVPLYQKIYELYKNKGLPGDAGLESDIRTMGVLESQAERARQVFQRSADKAGFFWGGRSRLVAPPRGRVETDAEPSDTATPAPAVGGRVSDPKESAALSNSLLVALIQKMLPNEGEEFPTQDRRRLFRALILYLDVFYGEPEDGEIDNNALVALFRDKTPAYRGDGAQPAVADQSETNSDHRV